MGSSNSSSAHNTVANRQQPQPQPQPRPPQQPSVTPTGRQGFRLSDYNEAGERIQQRPSSTHQPPPAQRAVMTDGQPEQMVRDERTGEIMTLSEAARRIEHYKKRLLCTICLHGYSRGEVVGSYFPSRVPD